MGKCWYSAEWFVEAKRLLVLAIPLMVQNLLATALSIMTIAFVGHLNDPLLLSSVVMGTSLFNITGLYIITGFSAGLDTLIGQAYGARQFRLMGITLQRALAICLLLCLPITAMWSHLGPVLLLLHQPLPIVEGACQFLSHTVPSLYLLAVGQCLARYLTAQQMVGAPLLAAIAEVVTAPVTYWLLVHKMELGLAGAAYAFNLANLVFTLVMAGYMVLHEMMMQGTTEQTWFGWSWDMFRGWRPYLQLALPACAMVCAEMWMFEVVILEAGLLPGAEVAQGVMGMMQQICTFLYMLPYGMGSAANVRIANELGSGQAAVARRIFHAALMMQMVIQVAIGSATYVFRSQLALIFTGSAEVLRLAEKVIPLVALNVVGDGLTTTQTGVLRGCGRQEIGAICNLLSYWVVGVPLTCIMGIYLQLGVIGFWLALAITMNLQGLVLLCVLLSLNWQREVERAKALVLGHSYGDRIGFDNPVGGSNHRWPPGRDSIDIREPLLVGFETIHATPYGPLSDWQVGRIQTPSGTPRNSSETSGREVRGEVVEDGRTVAGQAVPYLLDPADRSTTPSFLPHPHILIPPNPNSPAHALPIPLPSSLPQHYPYSTPFSPQARTPTLPLLVPRARGLRQSLVYEVSDLEQSGSYSSLSNMLLDDAQRNQRSGRTRFYRDRAQDVAVTL